MMDLGYTRHTSRKDTARLSTMTHGAVTAGSAVTVPCADCGLRTQICSNCWIRRLTENGFFYSEVEM